MHPEQVSEHRASFGFRITVFCSEKELGWGLLASSWTWAFRIFPSAKVEYSSSLNSSQGHTLSVRAYFFLRWLATRASRHHLPQWCLFIYWSNGKKEKFNACLLVQQYTIWERWGLNTASYLGMQNTHPVCNSIFLNWGWGRAGGTLPFPLDRYPAPGLRGYNVRLIFVMKTHFGNLHMEFKLSWELTSRWHDDITSVTCDVSSIITDVIKNE